MPVPDEPPLDCSLAVVTASGGMLQQPEAGLRAAHSNESPEDPVPIAALVSASNDPFLSSRVSGGPCSDRAYRFQGMSLDVSWRKAVSRCGCVLQRLAARACLGRLEGEPVLVEEYMKLLRRIAVDVIGELAALAVDRLYAQLPDNLRLCMTIGRKGARTARSGGCGASPQCPRRNAGQQCCRRSFRH